MATEAALTAIKLHMTERGLTQKALAEHLGVSPVWLSNLLGGKAEMKLDTFLKIAAWLNIPASKLLETYTYHGAQAA